MKILVLFSGTGSIEKVFDEEQHEIRGLDFDNKFEPYYNVDILTWKYKDILSKWIPNYIHGSPVCKEFSNIKLSHENHRDMGLGMSLLTKCLEIIEFVKSINSKLKYTIENPKGLMRKQKCMENYTRITTSYCMYGFPYKKETDFWYGGFELVLRNKCRRTKDQSNWCESMVKCKGVHRVRIAFGGKYINELQMTDNKYFNILRKEKEYKDKGYTDTYFRYRIPKELCEDIRDCVLDNDEEIEDINEEIED